MTKTAFEKVLKELAATLSSHVSTKDGQWAVKGFIDAYRNVLRRPLKNQFNQ
jgi:hypothetical protein